MASSSRHQYGLGDRVVPIFNVPDLIDKTRVFVTEGEKAVLRLAELGLTATCPPNGASQWRPAWSLQLWKCGAHDVFVLADRDAKGDAHAERVAAALSGFTHVPPVPSDMAAPDNAWPMAEAGDLELQTIRVKVVRLPSLPPGGDVVDFLQAGHGPADLLACVAATPWWTPALLAESRVDRKREQTKLRVQRYRAKRRAYVTQ